MPFSEEAEELLEDVWIARERSGSDCVKLKTPPSGAVVKELTEAGSIAKCEPDGITLTEMGLEEAGEAVRRHRLAERLLTDVLAVKEELIHDTACQFEHHLHKGIDANVCTLLGHPKVCPHGKPIPPGRCCKEGAKVVSQAVSPLAELKPGQGGQVAYLYTAEPKRAQMLLSMGVVPGAEIGLLAGFPSFLFQLGEGQFAVDSDVAREIYVRIKGQSGRGAKR